MYDWPFLEWWEWQARACGFPNHGHPIYCEPMSRFCTSQPFTASKRVLSGKIALERSWNRRSWHCALPILYSFWQLMRGQLELCWRCWRKSVLRSSKTIFLWEIPFWKNLRLERKQQQDVYWTRFVVRSDAGYAIHLLMAGNDFFWLCICWENCLCCFSIFNMLERMQ